MNTIDTSQLLSQLRETASLAKGAPVSASNGVEESFATLLRDSINSVNGIQKSSADLKTSFELGDPEVSLSQVMIAGGKADVAFQGMVQVRNKLLEAYHEIMRMPV